MELAVLPPGDQELPVVALEVKVTEPPAQNVVGPLSVMPAVGAGLTVTVCEAETGPQAVVSVTV